MLGEVGSDQNGGHPRRSKLLVFGVSTAISSEVTMWQNPSPACNAGVFCGVANIQTETIGY